MKLKIKKLPSGYVQIEVVPDTSTKKPLVYTLAEQQLPALIQILETARKANRFSFELEV